MAEAASHEPLTRGFKLVHAALRRSLESVVATSARPIPAGERAPFADFCRRVARFVHGHHSGEEDVVFPALEKAGLADVAVWKKEHESLLGVLARFEESIGPFESGSQDAQDALARAAGELRDVLVPHLDAEEATLDRAIRDLVTPDQATALAQAASRHGQRHGGPGVLLLFLHSLTDDEQRAHFSHMPWFVRRILVRIWDRAFRPAVRYAHNPSIVI